MSNALTRREISLGTLYAIFQFFALPQWAAIATIGTSISAWALQFSVFVINFLCTVLIYRRFLWESLQTVMDNPGRIFLFGLGGLAVYYAATLMLNFLILRLCPSYQNLNDSGIAKLLQENRFFMILGVVLLVPTTEEVIFRGLLFRGIYDRCPLAAWILSIGLFSAVHILGYIGSYSPLNLLLAFLQYLPAGWVLALSYKKTDTILTPVFIHTLVNLIGILLM